MLTPISYRQMAERSSKKTVGLLEIIGGKPTDQVTAYLAGLNGTYEGTPHPLQSSEESSL